jgi:hypothetical protein
VVRAPFGEGQVKPQVIGNRVNVSVRASRLRLAFTSDRLLGPDKEKHRASPFVDEVRPL